MSTQIFNSIDAFLLAEQPAQTRFLAELVRQPSDNPPGDCAPHAELAERLLTGLALPVERHVPAIEPVREQGMISIVNLVVRHVFSDDGPVVALNAHGDVVPPGQGWTREPYGARIEQDPEHGAVMFGRGVAVSKSDFATYTWALLALKAAQRAGARLRGAIELHLTYDEEAGGVNGPAFLLDSGASRPDLAISAGFAYHVTTAHNGCLHLEVSVHGRQAHAAMPHTGVDALQAANDVMQALYAYRRTLGAATSAMTGIGSPSMTIGLIRGGINTNVVPDLVTFRLDRRLIPEESGPQAEEELLAVIAEAARACQPGIEVRTRRLLLAEPLVQLPGAAALIEPLQRHAQAVFGVEIPVHSVPLYTDARHYTQRGIPTVLYGAGPRTLMEARGHNADENLRLNDLYGATRVVAHTLADILRAD
ncbi:MAG: M20/M25/M40 family metallo-hydrolase [Bordetella sp.]|uniref:M20/M25/M40 family metallo-hydrolase n=1 Tax=Bordetella sp. TaxID=28081 RepID=UPI003F7BE889